MAGNEKTDDKRELRKIDRRCLVFYLRVMDQTSSEILGYLIDISEEGVMLMGDSKVVVGEEYQLRMRLPALMKKDRDEVVLSATSKWCKPDKDTKTYLAGFQLGELHPAVRRLIKNLINDFGYNQGMRGQTP